MTVRSTDKNHRPSSLRLDYLTRPQLFAATCMAGVGIASFLPWFSEFGLGVSGIRGDGRVTLFCALVGLAVLAFSTDVIGRRRLTRQGYGIGSAPAAGFVLLTALGEVGGSDGIGLYLTLAAGIGWVFALVWDVNEHSTRMPLS